MNILIDISHPAHVHFFKHAYKIWQEHGHHVKVTARDKDVALQLLDDLKIPYQSISKIGKGFIGLSFELIQHEARLFNIAKRFNADVILEIGGTFIVHAGKLLGAKTVVFTDTEHAKLSNAITFPFATYICTPDSYADDLGEKQVRYKGYQELAYLHPNYFSPDPKILDMLNLKKNEKIFVLRFVSWGASHDIGKRGMSVDEKIRLVEILKEYGKVLITSESPLPDALDPYRISVSPVYIHALLSYAQLYIGEGATMASEAAILGTPSVYINPLGSGNLNEIIHKYQLMYHYENMDAAFSDILSFLNDSNLGVKHQERREHMINEKIDVTDWMVDFIEKSVS